MYNSNSLGIGTSGNTYNLVPENLRIPNNIIYGHNKNLQVNNNQIITKQENSQKEISLNNSNVIPSKNNKIEETSNLKDSKTKEVNNNNNIIEETSTDVQSQSQGQIPKQSSQQQVINYYQEVFRNIASNQLYGAFRKVKGITNNSDYFSDTKLAYINYDAMQQLINKARQENYNKGVMSLKTYLVNENQTSVDPSQLNDTLELIKIMEILGPPDHALIALNDHQIQHLKQNQFNEVFWPNGVNGITWLNKRQTGQTNW